VTAAEREELRELVEYVDALTARLERLQEATIDLRRRVDEADDDA
jgi:hypothetical protein